MLAGEVAIALGEAVDLPAGLEQTEKATERSKEESPSFGEAWVSEHVSACLRRLLPLLHRPTRCILLRTVLALEI